MSKVVVGFIPEKISYVYSDEKDVNVGCIWDIDSYENEDNKNVKMKVIPTFPVDPANEKSMKTAIDWASQGGWDQSTNKEIIKPYTILEVPNDPIKNVRVLSLEERGNGGRAYKVLINKYYVDLREDVLMDTLLQVGVAPGGILQGEYIWSQIGSHMKLIRIGSEVHRLINEFESKKNIKPINKKDLEVGGVYRDIKKKTAIFIGYVNTTLYEEEVIRNWRTQNIIRPNFNYKNTIIKKAMMFYEVYDFKGIDKSIKEMFGVDNSYQFKIKKSHTYIEKIKNVTIPDGIIENIRNKALKFIKNNILEFTGHIEPKKGYAKIDDWTLSSHISYYSEHLNIYPFEGTPVEPFDVKKFLIFS